VKVLMRVAAATARAALCMNVNISHSWVSCYCRQPMINHVKTVAFFSFIVVASKYGNLF
jgi:hypothetical protein